MAPLMQPVLNAPMSAHEQQQAGSIRLLLGILVMP
jgi:hypothetical protein